MYVVFARYTARYAKMEFLFEFVPASNSIPPTDRSRIACRTNEVRNVFSGQYSGSIKTPDIKLTLKDARGVSKVKLVMRLVSLKITIWSQTQDYG